MSSKYADYKEEMKQQVASCLKAKACQPILFIGSGFSRRHFDGPSWDELLSHLASACPTIDKEYAYFKQLYNGDMLHIGEEFAKLYHRWAWGSGKEYFPSEMYNESIPTTAYIKYAISRYLQEITPKKVSEGNAYLREEISAIKSVRPHAIITTNYDCFLELVFEDYTPIIGQEIIQAGSVSIGEVFKIHGCVSKPQSLVLTAADYADFMKRKKYLSAKLLTFFTEHPLLFVGYSAGDPNIRAILSDIDEALPVAGGIIPNVYILEWQSQVPEAERPQREKLIAIDDSKSVRVNCIVANDFKWVFEAFGSHQSLNAVSPKILRALLSRSYELVRHDIPRMTVQADFKMLEHAVENQENFATLFGVTTISDPSVIAAGYPYTISQVASKLNLNHWTSCQDIINLIKAKNNFNLKSCDNKYHCAIKYGKTTVHKYSEDAVILFRKVLEGAPYSLDIPGAKKTKSHQQPAQKKGAVPETAA